MVNKITIEFTSETDKNDVLAFLELCKLKQTSKFPSKEYYKNKEQFKPGRWNAASSKFEKGLTNGSIKVD